MTGIPGATGFLAPVEVPEPPLLEPVPEPVEAPVAVAVVDVPAGADVFSAVVSVVPEDSPDDVTPRSAGANPLSVEALGEREHPAAEATNTATTTHATMMRYERTGSSYKDD